MLKDYQKDFIQFLLQSNALQFGEFTLKSGRIAPYFVNAASFNDGELITRLGKFYASHIINSGLKDVNNIFGPAYKGIPLAVATSISLFNDFKFKCGYSFDRKEAKQHGDGGKIVGKKIDNTSKIVIVEDVVTAGTTLSDVIPTLRKTAEVSIEAVVIAVDRQEKGTQNISAVAELMQSLEIKILPIVTISQIIDYLSTNEAGSRQLDSAMLEKIKVYRKEYAA
jgi:orotate phosphoribosyltransferase